MDSSILVDKGYGSQPVNGSDRRADLCSDSRDKSVPCHRAALSQPRHEEVAMA